jgi:hypothetical protein
LEGHAAPMSEKYMQDFGGNGSWKCTCRKTRYTWENNNKMYFRGKGGVV